MAERTDRLRSAVEPVLAAFQLELYDLELTGQGRATTLRMLVDRPAGVEGGVDLDVISTATDALAPVLDDLDLVRGPYALEVSSPGLERPLRTPRHFGSALGSVVSIKTYEPVDGARRFRGELVATDDDGCTLDVDGVRRRFTYGDVAQARTVFEWGPAPKSGKGRSKGRKEAARR